MSELSGRALAEAAAKVMGQRRHSACWYPEHAPNCDYECLEWARENWRDINTIPAQRMWTLFLRAMQDKPFFVWAYQPGDYARALVAASKEGK